MRLYVLPAPVRSPGTRAGAVASENLVPDRARHQHPDALEQQQVGEAWRRRIVTTAFAPRFPSFGVAGSPCHP